MGPITKKNAIVKAIEKLAAEFGIAPDVIAIGIADDEGHCVVHFHGLEVKVACLVNELMGQAVAKMPRTMQEVMMAEILSNGKAAANETH